VTGAGYNPNGSRLLTWGRDGTARLWDADTGESAAPLLRHDAPVNGALFAAGGSRILTWSSDGTARLWDSETGGQVSSELLHPDGTIKGRNAVMTARLDPESGDIMTRDESGTLRIWSSPEDAAWPLDALELKVAVETGITLSPSGEVQVLPPAEWRRLRHCDYDPIRRRLGRLDDTAWAESRRRCQAAASEGESNAGILHHRPESIWLDTRR
jgi:WD40 repeat protein